MSVHAMKPVFTDAAGYRAWRQQWRTLYNRISKDIRKESEAIRHMHRAGTPCGSKQKELRYRKAMAYKLMSILGEAKARWARIMSIRQQIGTQNASFPITLSDCKTIDFHFNKGHLEFTDLPMWIIKAKGRTFYISHFTSDAPFSTRETPEGSTKGMLRFRECSLMIDASGSAHIADARALQIAA